MWANARAYSNPIYDLIDDSFTRPLMIDIEPICSYSNTNQIPLLLLANCLTTPSLNNHNYVNQRIDENLDPLYAKPRKRCVTLRDEPIIIPPKTSRVSLVRKIQRQRSIFFFDICRIR
jgi:hypothetical protein